MTLYRIAGALFGVAGASALVLGNDHQSLIPLPWLLVYLGASFCAVGVVALLRRPDNATGSLLYLVGIATFAVLLTDANEPALYTLGIALDSIVFAALVHLLLAYPTGAVSGRSRRVVIAGYALAAFGPLVSTLFADDPADCADCPANLLAVTDRPTVSHAVDALSQLLAAGLVATAAVLLFRRWQRASSAYRRSLRGVYATAAVAVVLLAVSFAIGPISRGAALAVLTGAVLALAALPFAFLLGLLRARFAGAAVGRLVSELGPNPQPGQLRQVLRNVLHDPGLEVGYRLPDSDGYVDLDGLPFAPAEGLALTYVAGSTGPSGVLAHDPALLEDAPLLDGVTAAVRLAVENEQLHAELRARLLDLQQLAAEQAALRRVATAVAAQTSEPELVRVVAGEVGALFDSTTGIVRADPVAQRGDNATARALRRGEPQHGGTSIAAPIVVGGGVWGAIEAARREPFPAGAEQRLADVAALFAQALANAEARSELRASRARIVEAGDAERRQAGAQPPRRGAAAARGGLDLAAAGRLGGGESAGRGARADSEPRRRSCRRRSPSSASSRAGSTLRSSPSAGSGRPLVALADAFADSVEVRNELAGALPPPVEAAAYYVVSEALANVVKHAQASTAQVRVTHARRRGARRGRR